MAAQPGKRSSDRDGKRSWLHGQKRTSCNNSAAGLLQACERFGRVDGILAVEFEFTVS